MKVKRGQHSGSHWETPKSLPPSPASPGQWSTERNWGFLVQWFKSGRNLLYSSRWLIHCVGSASLTRFTWIHLIFYILPFFFSLSPVLGNFLLGFSQGQADLQTPAFFPTECEEWLGQVVSEFLSALMFSASKFLSKLCLSFNKTMSLSTVRVSQLFLSDRF